MRQNLNRVDFFLVKAQYYLQKKKKDVSTTEMTSTSVMVRRSNCDLWDLSWGSMVHCTCVRHSFIQTPQLQSFIPFFFSYSLPQLNDRVHIYPSLSQRANIAKCTVTKSSWYPTPNGGLMFFWLINLLFANTMYQAFYWCIVRLTWAHLNQKSIHWKYE